METTLGIGSQPIQKLQSMIFCLTCSYNESTSVMSQFTTVATPPCRTTKNTIILVWDASTKHSCVAYLCHNITLINFFHFCCCFPSISLHSNIVVSLSDFFTPKDMLTWIFSTILWIYDVLANDQQDQDHHLGYFVTAIGEHCSNNWSQKWFIIQLCDL